MNIDVSRLRLELGRSIRPAALYLGLVAAGLFALGIILKNQTFQKPFTDYYQVKVAFDDAKGVVPGTQQVRIAGVEVGIIKKAELDDGRAVLTLSIKSEHGRLYRDARLRLRPATPLQDMYVSVEDRGNPKAGKLGGDDVLPEQQSESPVDIARVLDDFDETTRERLASLLHGFGKGLDDRGVSLRQAFAESAPFLRVAQRATTVFARRRAATRRLVTNISRLTGTLSERGRTLSRFVTYGQRTLGELAANDTSLAASLRELAPTIVQLDSSLTTVRAAEERLDPALRALDPVAAQLKDGLEGLAQVGRDARPALAALRSPVNTLRPFSRTLRTALGGLRTTARSFAEQAPAYNRITAQLPPCLRKLSEFFSNTMSVIKFSDANGAIPRAETTVGMDTLAPLLDSPKDPTVRKVPTCTKGGQDG